MSSDEYLWVTPWSQARAPMNRLTVIVVTVTVGAVVGSFVPFVPRSVLVILAKTVGDVMAEYELGVFAPEPESQPGVSATPGRA